MRAPLLTAGLLLLAVALPAQDRSKKFQFCKDDVSDGSFRRGIDKAHPRYFVEVFEVAPRGHQRAILTSRRGDPDTTTRIVCERVNAQVSHNGKIVIRINREFLQTAKFEGNFSIAGRVEGQGTSRPIEVPGYSVIGKESEVAPVGVAAASTMKGMIGELRRHWPDIEKTLETLQRTAGETQLEAQGRARNVARLEEQLKRRTDRQGAFVAARDSVQRALAAAGTPDSATPDLRRYRDSLRVYTAIVDSLRGELAANNIALRVATRDSFVRQGLRTLRENRALLLVLDGFIKPENLPLVRAVARSQHRLPDVLVALARNADSVWKQLLDARVTSATPDSLLSRYDLAIMDLRASMRDITQIDDGDANGNGDLQGILLGAVKDAEINVRQTGARVGDVIVLTFTDSVGVPASSRSAEVRMVVRDFGLVQRISDAVLLMNLAGEPREGERIAAAVAEAKAMNTPGSLELPVVARGSPTAGVSFGWVYSPRRDDDYSPLPYWLRASSAWLEPGFGFNAAAASVPMRRLTFAPDKAPSEEAVDSRIGYTLGGHLSMFDGALVWSGGWTLNGARARSYTGLGISFLSATDKAKELFKGLNP